MAQLNIQFFCKEKQNTESKYPAVAEDTCPANASILTGDRHRGPEERMSSYQCISSKVFPDDPLQLKDQHRRHVTMWFFASNTSRIASFISDDEPFLWRQKIYKSTSDIPLCQMIATFNKSMHLTSVAVNTTVRCQQHPQSDSIASRSFLTAQQSWHGRARAVKRL